MKNINELVGGVTTQLHIRKEQCQQLQTSEQILQRKELLSEVMERMCATWGPKWTKHLGDKSSVVFKEWLESTNDLTDEEIGLGYQLARDLCEFPPSIREFRRLAFGCPPYAIVDADPAAYGFDLRLNSWDRDHMTIAQSEKARKSLYETEVAMRMRRES